MSDSIPKHQRVAVITDIHGNLAALQATLSHIGELGVEAVAVYSTADRDSLHVTLADQAVHVGPPAAAQSYLNVPSLVAAATTWEVAPDGGAGARLVPAPATVG